jgi:exopolysaccharide biosynthesis WecB/TagA/CpsF family protein
MLQFTVGIPVFNGMPYLRESLESILRQTYADFELLVINDGSQDDSLEYLRSVRDPRLRVMSQQNQGLTATLNRMLSETRTPWLVRQDADDVSYPQRLARIAHCAGRHPEAGMFYSLADYYPSSSVGQFRSSKGTPDELREIVRSGYLLSICHPSVTLNVEKTRALGGYRFDLHVEDIDLWWRMALRHDIRFIPEATVGMRQNQQSVSYANLRDQALHTLYVQYQLLSRLWDLEPSPIEAVRNPLARIVKVRKLRSKEHLRAFNMEWSDGNRAIAILEMARAFTSTPSGLFSRIADEFVSRRKITVGESPKRFVRLKNELWPADQKYSEKRCQPANLGVVQGVGVNFPAFNLMDIRVQAITAPDLLSIISEATQKQAKYVIANHNTHSLYLWHHDARMRDFHARADFTHVDSMPLIALLRPFGIPLRREHRTGYMDFLPLLAREAVRRGWRIYHLGSKPGIGEKGAAILREQYPGLQIRSHHGYFDIQGTENKVVLADIHAYSPDVLLVGMGMPRQEIWINDNLCHISARTIFCSGGMMDFVAQEIPTPPRWLGQVGLEWFYRLCSEPSRLGRRYLVEPWFVLGQLAGAPLKFGRSLNTANLEETEK